MELHVCFDFLLLISNLKKYETRRDSFGTRLIVVSHIYTSHQSLTKIYLIFSFSFCLDLNKSNLTYNAQHFVAAFQQRTRSNKTCLNAGDLHADVRRVELKPAVLLSKPFQSLDVNADVRQRQYSTMLIDKTHRPRMLAEQ